MYRAPAWVSLAEEEKDQRNYQLKGKDFLSPECEASYQLSGQK